MSGSENVPDLKTAAELMKEYVTQNAKITVQFFDLQGRPITEINHEWDFFKVMMKSEAGAERLAESHSRLAFEALRHERIHHAVCSFTGLLHACVPVYSNEKTLGYWLAGQTLLSEEERSYEYYEQYLRGISQTINLHVYPLRRLLRELPVLSQEEFMEAVRLVGVGSSAALKKLLQGRTIHMKDHNAPTSLTTPAS